MSLSDEYKRQFGWRSWSSIFGALPPLQGRTILDLDCGVGDQAAEIVARGARVIGIDMNEELLREAQSRQLPDAEFRIGDLRHSPDLGVAVVALWCSFTAAHFPDLPAAPAAWASHLRPEGWVVLTEVDDLFGHEPLSARTKALLEGYARDALAAGRYDADYAAVRRDGVELHLQWHDAAQREEAGDRPTYRFVVADVDGLYREFRDAGVSENIKPVAETSWGTREFHVRDLDGNGLQFYRPL